VLLEVAAWALDLQAYLSEAAATVPTNAVASGKAAEIVVSEGETTPVPVVLAPKSSSGTGSLSYHIRQCA
jgi:hypothetical protein